MEIEKQILSILSRCGVPVSGRAWVEYSVILEIHVRTNDDSVVEHPWFAYWTTDPFMDPIAVFVPENVTPQQFRFLVSAASPPDDLDVKWRDIIESAYD